MLFDIRITGITGIIMHSATGMDPRLPANIEKAEITRKQGSNRTEADEARLRQLECLTSLWLDDTGKVTIPPAAFRACIEKGARKLRQGPQVREGLLVLSSEFHYDRQRYSEDIDELTVACQFVAPVVVGRSRILRTRAMFELDWGATFQIECDDELVDSEQLTAWLDIAGRRIGLGDWRPEKSGHYGRFTAEVAEG